MTDDELDEALGRWGAWQPRDDAAVARIIAHADGCPAPPVRAAAVRHWWVLGASAAVAASVLVAVLLGVARPDAPPPAGRPDMRPADSFAMLYTPTPDEEYLL